MIDVECVARCVVSILIFCCFFGNVMQKVLLLWLLHAWQLSASTRVIVFPPLSCTPVVTLCSSFQPTCIVSDLIFSTDLHMCIEEVICIIVIHWKVLS